MEGHHLLHKTACLSMIFSTTFSLLFSDYFHTLTEMHGIPTKERELGCLYVPCSRTTRYGLKSFTHKCIDNWNFFSSHNTKLRELPRHELKNRITNYFISSYQYCWSSSSSSHNHHHHHPSHLSHYPTRVLLFLDSVCPPHFPYPLSPFFIDMCYH